MGLLYLWSISYQPSIIILWSICKELYSGLILTLLIKISFDYDNLFIHMDDKACGY
jgi:hypothetical protein